MALSVRCCAALREISTPDKSRHARAALTRRIKRSNLFHIFAPHGYAPLPEYVEPLISPVSRPDLAAEYPLVLTNAKFTTYIHSQLRGLPSLRKASPRPDRRYSSRDRESLRHQRQRMDDHRKPPRKRFAPKRG